MRLSKIKLAGFKSFVDPTSIQFPSNLVGIVGPNGCGKSNVIDAIRWVMGESSAKHLRGDSMADVIFNGSSSRKPVGTASVELYFDNSDGAIGGQYAEYSEVCIKRVVTREGTSQYYLNNTRCRRKDITGIFLGTGLGPRSYAIIEQGMISRLIEAKPEEMRVYIEEAAGISKYKERRRETENRIRHTRDNLDRLTDLREEIEKQILHLEKQAKQAERFKELKQEERLLEAELLAIRLTTLQTDMEQHGQRLSQAQTAHEAAMAEQRGSEAEIETAREAHTELQDSFALIQGRYYEVQSEISKLEQSIEHTRELRERQQSDLSQANTQLSDVDNEIDKDQAQLDELEARLVQLAPDLEQARAVEQASLENLQRVESALEDWQSVWHEFTLETKEYQQVSHVERTRIEQIDERLIRLKEQRSQLAEQKEGISLESMEESLSENARSEATAEGNVARLDEQLEEVSRQIVQYREQEQNNSAELEQARGELESRRGRAETLEALQEAAFGQGEDNVKNWLSREKLSDLPRLAQQLVVEKPWELAVETVLGNFLQAICVSRFEDHLSGLPDGDVMLIGGQDISISDADKKGSLLSKVQNPGSAAASLRAVRVAKTLDEALALQQRLQPGESVVTSDGVWLGPGWVRISRGELEAGGFISREQDIRELREHIRDYEQQIVRLQTERDAAREQLLKLEAQRTDVEQQSKQAHQRLAEAVATLSANRQDYERVKETLATLERDAQAVRNELETLEGSIRESQSRLSHAAKALDRVEKHRPVLEEQREQLQSEFEEAKQKADADRIEAARINVEFESRRASQESAHTTLTRIHSQQEQLRERVTSLQAQVEQSDEPIIDLQKGLEERLQQEVAVDHELSEQRTVMETAAERLRSEEARRGECEQGVAEARLAVDDFRMQVREIEVRREGVDEQFGQTGLELEKIIAELPDDVELHAWDEKLSLAKRRIDRLGGVNLAAIDELTEQTERKVYLDAQDADLTAALDTLEGAIRKIDRETRTRFQETFDNVNLGMQKLFPKLFGGGHAYLTLEGDDLLSAGVTVMARPPGKRNSSIHLLSGGEKALTAVALVFSIFELNPAPFCLLDEVDAPLDDANVARFCEIVREMSEAVQFLVITHNKATMEMASQLTGVTMNEPGVSRLVSVDIDEAVQLVAS